MSEKKSKFRRIHFEVTEELFNVIEDLAIVTGSSSKAELMRRSIGLMAVVLEAKKRKERVMLADDQRKTFTELILW